MGLQSSNTAKQNLLRFTHGGEDGVTHQNAEAHLQAILGVINELDRKGEGRLTDPLKQYLDRTLGRGTVVLSGRQLDHLTREALSALVQSEKAQEYYSRYPERIFELANLKGLEPGHNPISAKIIIVQEHDPKEFTISLSSEPRDSDKLHLPTLLGVTLLAEQNREKVDSHLGDLHEIVTYSATVQGKPAHVSKDFVLHTRLDIAYTVTFETLRDAEAFKYSLQVLVDIQDSPDATSYREFFSRRGSQQILLDLGIPREPNKQTIERNLGKLKLDWKEYRRAARSEWQDLADYSHQHGMTLERFQQQAQSFWGRVRARAETKT